MKTNDKTRCRQIIGELEQMAARQQHLLEILEEDILDFDGDD